MELDQQQYLADCERLIGMAKVCVQSLGPKYAAATATLAARLEGVYKDARTLVQTGALPITPRLIVGAVPVEPPPGSTTEIKLNERDIAAITGTGCDSEGGTCD